MKFYNGAQTFVEPTVMAVEYIIGLIQYYAMTKT